MLTNALGAAAAVALTVAAASTAMADPIYSLTLQDAGGTVSTTDNGTGKINYNGILGGFDIQNLAVSDLNPNNPLDVALGSNDIFRASGNDTLFVYVTVSNLGAISPQTLGISTTASSNFDGSQIQGWTSQTYYDAQNRTGIAGTNTLLSAMKGGITPNSFTKTAFGNTLLNSNLFSYTVKFTLHLLTNEFANQAGATTDVSLTPIPEPASLALLAAGLVGLVAIRRKRA